MVEGGGLENRYPVLSGIEGSNPSPSASSVRVIEIPMQKQVRCPVCKGLTIYSTENPYRPFCSERCKLIDLGAWLDGDYFIPAKDDESDNNATKVDCCAG